MWFSDFLLNLAENFIYSQLFLNIETSWNIKIRTTQIWNYWLKIKISWSLVFSNEFWFKNSHSWKPKHCFVTYRYTNKYINPWLCNFYFYFKKVYIFVKWIEMDWNNVNFKFVKLKTIIFIYIKNKTILIYKVRTASFLRGNICDVVGPRSIPVIRQWYSISIHNVFG